MLSQASTHVAGTFSYADRYAEAEEVLARTDEEARRIGSMTALAAACQLRARLRLWTGSIADVLADATTAVDIFSSGRQMYLPASAYCLARGLIENDQPDEAEEVLATIERDAPPAGIFAAWQHEARGRLAAARGDWARALEEFRACGRWTGARVELAYTLLDLGEAIRRAGRPTEARDALREAISIAEAIGAQGRTNRQIADELFVTVKAVEWHLGNSYRKLDIRGRGALAQALSRPQ